MQDAGGGRPRLEIGMKGNVVLGCFVVLMITSSGHSQNPPVQHCGVGVADANRKLVGYQFEAVTGDWHRTTKAYRLPGTRLFFVASITYSENNSSSVPGPESTLLELQVSERPKRDHMKSLAFAHTETRFDQKETTFLQLLYRRKGRPVLIGNQCSDKEK